MVAKRSQFRHNRWVDFAVAWLGLTLAGCLRPAPTVNDYRSRIGVAVKLPDRICLAIRNAKLLPSATITLLAPGVTPQTARAQVLERGADACPGSRSDGAMSNYTLQIMSGGAEPNRPLVALDARVPSVYEAHSFHSCRSADGIHLTAWDGAKPLEGHRLWHQYYFVRHELTADCVAAESLP